MRFTEIYRGVRVVISNEEADLLDKIKANGGKMFKEDLSDRETVIVNQLVNKSLTRRKKDNGKLYFVPTKTQ